MLWLHLSHIETDGVKCVALGHNLIVLHHRSVAQIYMLSLL